MSLTKTQKEILRAWPREGYGILTAAELAKLPVNGARSENETVNVIERLQGKGLCQPGVTKSRLANGREFTNMWLTPEGITLCQGLRA